MHHRVAHGHDVRFRDPVIAVFENESPRNPTHYLTVLTPMNQEAIDDPKVRKEQTDSIPMKRAAKPEEVAELALYLASSASDYVTGSTFTIDGGLTRNLGQGA